MDKSLISEEKEKKIILGTIPPEPINIELQLSYKCNAKCIMCDMEYRDKSKELSLNQLINLIDCLKKLGNKMIILTGGEPFLRKDIYQIIKYANNKEILVTIHTNGLLINKQNIHLLSGLNINTINVSLHYPSKKQDAICNVSGAYKKIVNSINLLKKQLKNETKINLRCVLTKQNYTHIKDFEHLLNKTNVDSIKFIFARPLEKNSNDKIFLNKDEKKVAIKLIKDLSKKTSVLVKPPQIKLLKNTKCLCSKLRATITPNGNVIPSCYCENIIFGNINTTSFEKIWFSEKANKIRTKHCLDCQQSLNQNLNQKYLVKK